MSNQNFVEWFSFHRKHVLRQFQNDIIDDALEHPYLAVLGARQIGKTRVLGMLAIMLSGGVNSKAGFIPAHDVYIISATATKAMHVIKEIRKLIDEMDLIEKVSHDILGGKSEIVLRNGQSIIAVAGKPGCLQGHTGSCLFDEASLTEHDASEIYEQVLAATSAHPYFRVVLASNADGMGSWVWSMWHSPEVEWVRMRKGLRMHCVSIYDAYPDGLPPHIQDRKDMMSRRGWRRWYENAFLTGDDCRFIIERIHEATTQQWSNKNGLTILSIDPGFSITGNPSGVCIANIQNGRMHVVFVDLWHGIPEPDQRARIAELVTQYGVNRIVIDQGAQGMLMRDALIRTYGSRVVIPISVNRGKYVQWCNALEQLFDTGRVRMPRGVLVDDLSSIEVTSKGDIIVPERAMESGKGKIHADSAVALMMLTEHVGTTGEELLEAEIVDVDDPYATDGNDLIFGGGRSYTDFI